MRMLLIGPIHTSNQAANLVYNEMVRQHFQVSLLSNRTSLRELQLAAISGFNVAFVFGRGSLPVEHFTVLKRCGLKVIVWDNDTLDVAGMRSAQWLMRSPYIDGAITSMVDITRWLQESLKLNAYWSPPFFDAAFYEPALPEDHKPSREVVFIGHLNDVKRADWIGRLRSEFDVHVVTNMVGAQAADAYRDAKIAIDIKRVPFIYGEFNTSNRLMKALGAGACYLTYEIPGIERCFTPDVHLATYNDTYGDLVAKIKLLLADDEKRAHLAYAGRLETLRCHSLSSRVQDYRQIVDEICS